MCISVSSIWSLFMETKEIASAKFSNLYSIEICSFRIHRCFFLIWCKSLALLPLSLGSHSEIAFFFHIINWNDELLKNRFYLQNASFIIFLALYCTQTFPNDVRNISVFTIITATTGKDHTVMISKLTFDALSRS